MAGIGLLDLITGGSGPREGEAPPEVKERFKAEAAAEADAASGGDPKIWQRTFDTVYRSRMMNWKPEQQSMIPMQGLLG